MTSSLEQRKIGIGVIMAVSETIRQAKRCPSGTIYAALMGRVDMEGYQRILSILKGAGLIEMTKGGELVWVGPAIAERPSAELGPVDALEIRYRHEKSVAGHAQVAEKKSISK